MIEDHHDLLRQALETARHDLAAAHGLWATDRPELFASEKFVLDYGPTITLIDEAIMRLSAATREGRRG